MPPAILIVSLSEKSRTARAANYPEGADLSVPDEGMRRVGKSRCPDLTPVIAGSTPTWRRTRAGRNRHSSRPAKVGHPRLPLMRAAQSAWFLVRSATTKQSTHSAEFVAAVGDRPPPGGSKQRAARSVYIRPEAASQNGISSSRSPPLGASQDGPPPPREAAGATRCAGARSLR